MFCVSFYVPGLVLRSFISSRVSECRHFCKACTGGSHTSMLKVEQVPEQWAKEELSDKLKYVRNMSRVWIRIRICWETIEGYWRVFHNPASPMLEIRGNEMLHTLGVYLFKRLTVCLLNILFHVVFPKQLFAVGVLWVSSQAPVRVSGFRRRHVPPHLL